MYDASCMAVSQCGHNLLELWPRLALFQTTTWYEIICTITQGGYLYTRWKQRPLALTLRSIVDELVSELINRRLPVVVRTSSTSISACGYLDGCSGCRVGYRQDVLEKCFVYILGTHQPHVTKWYVKFNRKSVLLWVFCIFFSQNTHKRADFLSNSTKRFFCSETWIRAKQYPLAPPGARNVVVK